MNVVMILNVTLVLKSKSGSEVCNTVRSLTLAVRHERESRGEAGAGKGVCARLSMNVGETGRGDGVKKRRRRVKGGQSTRLRGGRAGKEDGLRKEGMMSERIASCGSLYDSTNLLLQYCNNGELLLISPQEK